MKKFIINVVVYLALPILVIMIAIESILNIYPNTFSQRAKFLQNNQNSIEYLFLGSSHTQDGINPNYFDRKTVNLGYGFQDYQIDSAIVAMQVENMSSLKFLFHELDYLDLYKKMDSTYFRYPWYERHYGFKLGEYPFYYKYSYYLSNPDFFNQFFKNEFWKDQNIDQYGFNDIETQSDFYNLKYDSIQIFRADYSNIENYPLNESNLTRYKLNVERINFIKNVCKNYDVQYIHIVYPAHATYRNRIQNSESFELWRDFIKQEIEAGIKVWDFYDDDRFYIKDFSNPTHLNNHGAAKFSRIINDSINAYMQSQNIIMNPND